MDNKPIDFSPLAKINKGVLLGSEVNLQYIAISALVLGGALVFIAINSILTPTPQLLPTLCFLPGTPLVYWAVKKLLRLKKQTDELLTEFAFKNSWQPLSKELSLQQVPPSLTDIGHNQASTQGVSGVLNNYKFSLFEYGFITGEGKYQIPHDKLVLKMSFDSQLPRLLLVHKRSLEKRLDDISDPYNKPDNSQKLSLEGDFDKYFELYAVDQVTTLEIISPDFMQQLIQINRVYNLEFDSNNIYIITDGFIDHIKEVQATFQIATLIQAPIINFFKLTKAPDKVVNAATASGPMSS